LITYVSRCPVDFHVQEFITYENEVGIFYYCLPGTGRGNISGIVHKEFLKVTGDGKQKISDLLQANPRGVLQLPQLRISEPEVLEKVLAPGEIFTVVPYGNHARGAIFLDDSASVNSDLISIIDSVCKKIPLFYFGRMDIRYQSRQLLEQGKFFSILEVNGAGSEPTHIYDPCHSIFFAWKEIIRHWVLLYRISRANHRLGHRYLSVTEGLQMFREDSSNSKKLATMP
ncbi:MAG: D-alanine--D-alanine ligase, partial [Bacteroidota bacterium]|nr:D-alanine--D-alanine ligase [Bacteroidota bacterium]